MTERLYYADSYTRIFTARVVEFVDWEGQPAVVLDRTYFYPNGGGQPADAGMIGGVPVLDVQTRKDDHAVVHVLASKPDSDEVTCEVDWTRRFDHMQQHTGQHILTQAFVQTANAMTVGFHLSGDTVTIDLDRVNLTDEQVTEAETLANRVVQGNHEVRARLISPDDAEALAGVRMRKMPDGMVTDGLRVVEIGDFDLTACGGTHVMRTGEIGMIKVIRLEKRGDKTRVEFKCGGRALEDFREKNAVLVRSTPLLNCGYWEVDQAIARLQDQLKNAQRQLKAVTAELIEYRTAEWLNQAETVNGVRYVTLVHEDYDMEQARIIAKTLTAYEGVIVLIGLPGERANLIFARSADLTHDMNPALKAALAILGQARGGGKPDFVQGGGVPANADLIREALSHARTQLA